MEEGRRLRRRPSFVPTVSSLRSQPYLESLAASPSTHNPLPSTRFGDFIEDILRKVHREGAVVCHECLDVAKDADIAFERRGENEPGIRCVWVEPCRASAIGRRRLGAPPPHVRYHGL